jgi:hypothetical protein
MITLKCSQRAVMNRRTTVMGVTLCSVLSGQLWALDYLVTPPGETIASANDGRLVLANRVLDAAWTLDTGRIKAVALCNKHTDQTLQVKAGHTAQSQ